jgi:predicted DNA-binding transcriptional regulator AlpA
MTMEGIQVLREADRFRLTGLSRTQWWRLERKGKAPKRIQLGENSVGWLRHELEAWIKRKASAR